MSQIDPETGRPLDTHDRLEAYEFGVNENFKEAGNVLIGGVQDAWNNTMSLGRYFDPQFWTLMNL